jgi:hypothetical protein
MSLAFREQLGLDLLLAGVVSENFISAASFWSKIAAVIGLGFWTFAADGAKWT